MAKRSLLGTLEDGASFARQKPGLSVLFLQERLAIVLDDEIVACLEGRGVKDGVIGAIEMKRELFSDEFGGDIGLISVKTSAS